MLNHRFPSPKKRKRYLARRGRLPGDGTFQDGFRRAFKPIQIPARGGAGKVYPQIAVSGGLRNGLNGAAVR